MQYTLNLWGFKVAVALGVALSAWTSAEAQRLTWLGAPNAGSSEAYGVSADGTVVVGYENGRAVRWYNRVKQDLGVPNGRWSEARAVSADGSVVVGWIEDNSHRFRAFHWRNGVVQELGTLAGFRDSRALGVSADGSTVVGNASNGYGGVSLAFRWHNGMMENLGAMGGDRSYAVGVSADGSTVVGGFRDDAHRLRVFHWHNGTMQDIGSLSGGPSIALAVSADGSTVVGASRDSDHILRAYRWKDGVMRRLGTLGGSSIARGVSADGRVVVGEAIDSESVMRAFRWTEARGMEDLNRTYAHLLRDQSLLAVAYAVSLDGRYIVGGGRRGSTLRGEAFLLDTWRTGDTDGNGCINDADLLNVLFAFGTRGTGYTRHEDIDKNGIVDDADLLVVLLNFGQGCR